MKRPSDLFDRVAEWNDMIRFVKEPGPGLGLGVVYGRRRQGKSFLLRHLASSFGGFYHQALEEGSAAALQRIGDAVAQVRGFGEGGVRFGGWREALRAALMPVGPTNGTSPPLLILDEFPYFLAASPELPSVLQELVDESRYQRGPRGRVVICGSAVSVMSLLLSGGRALRGRASLELVLRAFDYRDARRYWGVRDLRLAFLLHAIVGGTPGYRDLLGAAPRSVSQLGAWLAAGILNPSHALFREADYLLTEDPRITDRGLYHAVLAAVSRGEGTPSRVASRLARPEAALRHPLALLEEAGLIRRNDDVLKQRNPTLAVADPLLRFSHTVMRPRLAELEQRRAAEVWKAAQTTFAAQILGPHFEDLCRSWVSRYASGKTLGGAVGEVGTTTLADPARKTTVQVDVVALAAGERRQGKRPRVLLLGEAKASARARTLEDLAHLERARTLLSQSDRADIREAKLAIFGRAGFDAALKREAAAREEIVLVDLARLYDGD